MRRLLTALLLLYAATAVATEVYLKPVGYDPEKGVRYKLETVEPHTPEPEDPTDPVDPDPTDPVDPEPEPDDPITPLDGTSNERFAALSKHPNCLAAWSLRDGDYGRYAADTSQTTYSEKYDALRLALPATGNSLDTKTNARLTFPPQSAATCERLFVQFDYLISQDLHDVYKAPTDGSSTYAPLHKFVQLLGEGGKLLYELRAWYDEPHIYSQHDLRCYAAKLEGRTERDQFASDVNCPECTFKGSGGGYDKHPSPESDYICVKPASLSERWQSVNGKWNTAYFQIDFTPEGNRVLLWLENEDAGRKAIVSSPVDASRGFLTSSRAIETLYLEMLSSKSGNYINEADRIERPAYFRNVVVLQDVTAEEVFGVTK